MLFLKRYMRALYFLLLLSCALISGAVDLDRMQQLARSRYGQEAANTVSEWRSLIDESKKLPEMKKLIEVNNFFNDRIRWVQDPEAWQQADYWATPLQTMGKKMGDCEDFAIAKYATLILAGIDVNKLRITYVKAAIGGIHAAHMVLAYYETPTAEPRILDNLKREIFPASWRKDLTPVYGFNSRGIWVGGQLSPSTPDTGANLSRWSDLLQRAAAEGLG
jgi:predicted transglutaminase-like cysteine proteinase